MEKLLMKWVPGPHYKHIIIVYVFCSILRFCLAVRNFFLDFQMGKQQLQKSTTGKILL